MSGNERRYQILLLGPAKQVLRQSFVSLAKTNVDQLGDELWRCIDVVDGAPATSFDQTSPVVAIWFGSNALPDQHDRATLTRLLSEAKIVIPVVQTLSEYQRQVPNELHLINGIAIGTPPNLDRVVNASLEAFQLLRRRRRLFISYARKDSRAAAKQLFGALSERGYDVFLDTHSTPAAIEFQRHLWHSMVDSDLVVLLDTDRIESSRWCREEYERADALSIGVVRVIWPNRLIDSRNDPLQLSYPLKLGGSDFVSGTTNPGADDELTEGAISIIGNAVEGFRARSIAARQANLITSFTREATFQRVPFCLQPNSHVIVKKIDGRGKTKTIAIIPTVGVPLSTNYHDAFVEYDADPLIVEEQVVLYDRRGFLPSWVDHLTWLHGTLPVRGIDISEAVTWLSTL